MRRLILKLSMSLDGFIGGPNGEIDWIFRGRSDAATAWTVERLWSAGAHLMGSRTFRDMIAWWPTSSEPYATPMNEIPKIVFSRRGRAALDEGTTTTALENAAQARPDGQGGRDGAALRRSWAASEVASGPLATEVARLKSQAGKDLLAHGGASFARSLVTEGLVDEYWLLVHPVALGRGVAPFAGLLEPRYLKCLSSTPFPGGIIAHVFQPAVADRDPEGAR